MLHEILKNLPWDLGMCPIDTPEIQSNVQYLKDLRQLVICLAQAWFGKRTFICSVTSGIWSLANDPLVQIRIGSRTEESLSFTVRYRL